MDGVVVPVSVSSGVMNQNRAGGLGVAARRAVVLGMTVVFGCAVFAALSHPEGHPSVLAQAAWMRSLDKQKQVMSPDQMFMTAIKSGLMAANDANQIVPTSPATLQLAVQPIPKMQLAFKPLAKTTQSLDEVQAEPAAADAPATEAASTEAAVADDASDSPVEAPAVVQAEDAAADSALPAAAADAQVPAGVVEGQEQIADNAVPEDSPVFPDGSQPYGGIPAGYHLVAAGVAAMQDPEVSKPLTFDTLQGSPFQMPEKTLGVGIVENAVNLPPALFPGGGWSTETINGLPPPAQITVTVHKPSLPAAPAAEEAKPEEAKPVEPAAEIPAAEEAKPEEAKPVEPADEASAAAENASAAENATLTEEAAAAEAIPAPGATMQEPALSGFVPPQYAQVRMAVPMAAPQVHMAVPMARMAVPMARMAVPMARMAVPMAIPMMDMAVGSAYAQIGVASMPQALPVGASFCELGKRQSPINIEFNIAPRPLPNLLWQVTSGAAALFRASPVTINSVVNGRSLILSGASALMPIGGISYALQSVYLHSASEHAIAGQKFDMEMQFLHIAIVNGVQRFMVVSVFGRLSTESAPFLATLASSLPTGFTTAEPVISINLAEIAAQVLGQVIYMCLFFYLVLRGRE